MVATVDACDLADELKVRAFGRDKSEFHMTGSPVPDAVGRNHSSPPELSPSSWLTAHLPDTIESQSDHSTVPMTGQVPAQVPGNKVGVTDPTTARLPQ